MSRHIDIEITSIGDDTATWRAAGARAPKGSVATTILGTSAAVGTVFRAEIEQFMEGVEIISVAPPRTASPVDPRQERLSLLTPAPSGPDVQVTYAPKGRGRRDGDRPARRDRPAGGDRRDRPAGGERRERSTGSDRRERPAGSERRSTPRERIPTETGSAGPDKPIRERPARERRPARTDGPARTERTGPRTERPPRGRSDAPGDRRSRPVGPPVVTTHRNAFLATLTSEHLPIAEELLRGGMPAVRKALDDQIKTATAQGRATVNAEAITHVAEEMLGRANLANWKDRAAGAIGAGKELRLRDLRPVVTSARTVILDDEGKAQLKELQQSLTLRVTALRDEWNAKLARALEDKNVVEALTLTARPPEPTSRVSSDTATKIAALASEALTADADPDLWRRIVTAAIPSPLCRLIRPSGVPDDEETRTLARRSAGSIPEIAKLLGMKVPPPPPPTRAPRRVSPPRRSS